MRTAVVLYLLRGFVLHERKIRATALARFLFLALLIASGVMQIGTAQANPKYAAIVIDANNGNTLFARHADKRRYPASLAKMMTLYILFEELEAGRLSLNSKITVSKNAARQPASKIGFKTGASIKAKDAILALVVKSANDVATAVAEHISGSEKNFARRMTKTAKRIGLRATQFRNASGLPNRQQYTTARDMATLGQRVRSDFPQYYSYFSHSHFTFRGRRYRGHNRLVRNYKGADGIKTGYIRASGFNLVSSAERDGRRVIAVVMGGRTAKRRDNHSIALLSRYLPKASRTSRFHVELPKGPLPSLRRVATRVVTSVAKAEVATPVALAKPGASMSHASTRKKPLEENAGKLIASFIRAQGAPSGDSWVPLPPQRVKTTSLASVIPALIPPLPPIPLQAEPPGEVGSAEVGLEEILHVGSFKGNGWAIQLGTHESSVQAKNKLIQAMAIASETLRDSKAVIIPLAFGDDRTHYWSGFSGFKTVKQADAACTQLRQKRVWCAATSATPQSASGIP